jgi:hypothetical protein
MIETPRPRCSACNVDAVQSRFNSLLHNLPSLLACKVRCSILLCGTTHGVSLGGGRSNAQQAAAFPKAVKLAKACSAAKLCTYCSIHASDSSNRTSGLNKEIDAGLLGRLGRLSAVSHKGNLLELGVSPGQPHRASCSKRASTNVWHLYHSAVLIVGTPSGWHWWWPCRLEHGPSRIPQSHLLGSTLR